MHKALETLQFQTNQNIYEYILRNLPVDNNEQYICYTVMNVGLKKNQTEAKETSFHR